MKDLRYTLTAPDGVAKLGPAPELPPRYNVAPGQHAPIAKRDGIGLARWGLLPRWRGHGGKRGALVHAAPLEAVPGTPLLRDSFKKQRCLALADGCFAWRELNQPIWVHPEPVRVIAFAAVWAVNPDDDQPSFAMLTGTPFVTRVNHLMPIVIEPASYDAWLDPAVPAERAIELLAAPRIDGWRSDAVSTWMSSEAHDDPRCVAPIGNPAQGQLF